MALINAILNPVRLLRGKTYQAGDVIDIVRYSGVNDSITTQHTVKIMEVVPSPDYGRENETCAYVRGYIDRGNGPNPFMCYVYIQEVISTASKHDAQILGYQHALTTAKSDCPHCDHCWKPIPSGVCDNKQCALHDVSVISDGAA